MLSAQKNEQEVLVSTNPARGYEILGEVYVSSSEEIQAKVSAARKAQKEWWKMGLDARITHLRKLEAIFKAHRDELIQAPIVEAGVTRDLSTGLADSSEESFAWNLDHAREALASETLHEDENTIVEKLLKNLNINPTSFLMEANQQSIKDELKRRTDNAYKKGIFGTPSFIINNKIFWKQDRLEFVISEALK